MLLFAFRFSVGSSLPSDQPRSPVYLLGGRLAAALGDVFTLRHARVFARQG